MIAARTFTDPSALAPQYRRGLRLIAENDKLYRRAGGYGKTPDGVSLDVVQTLIGLGAVTIVYANGGSRPALTGHGRTLYDVLQQRAKQRGRA